MRTEKIKCVVIRATDAQDEYYEVGDGVVTSIEWGEIAGHMAMLDTVRVFRDEKLYSEHLFANCLGVYFQ